MEAVYITDEAKSRDFFRTRYDAFHKWKEAGLSFGRWLLGELSAREIDQAELARRTGAGTGTVSRWANDKSTPTVENIVDIARALRLPPEEVFNRAAGVNHDSDGSLVALLARELPATMTPHEARLVVHLLRGSVQAIRAWNKEEDARDRAAHGDEIRNIDAGERSEQMPLHPVQREPG